MNHKVTRQIFLSLPSPAQPVGILPHPKAHPEWQTKGLNK